MITENEVYEKILEKIAFYRKKKDNSVFDIFYHSDLDTIEKCIKSQMEKEKTMKKVECIRTDCEYFYENYCLADRKIFINEDGCKTFKEGTNILYKGNIDICNWCKKYRSVHDCNVNTRDMEIVKGKGVIRCKGYDEI